METVEDLWMESTRRHYQRRREEHRWAWVRHFDRMAASHARISEDYQRRAEELCAPELCAPARGDTGTVVTTQPNPTGENKM